MYVSRDLDGDGDMDLIATRGNSGEYDGVFWLEQIRSKTPSPSFIPARKSESRPFLCHRQIGWKYTIDEPPISHPTRSAISPR